MDSAFDRMLDIINGDDDLDSSQDSDDDNIENANYDDDLQAAIDEVRQLAPPNVVIEPKYEMIEVVEFDVENNVLDQNIRTEFRTECVFEETHIFSQPVSTTNTMEGYLSNVSFHERDLIQELIPNEDMVLYRCNYGKIKFDGYNEPVKLRKTNRGRKKKPKQKKSRKKQGDGVDFNSQITFVVRSSLTPNIIDDIVPEGTKVYKFKVFRTGKLQLPGVHQHLIDDVIICTKKIVQVLNFHLHPGEDNPARISNVINMNPVMKNYKFIVKLPPGHIIDMEALRQILLRERSKQFAVDGEEVDEMLSPEHPPIFMLKYTRQDTKLSVKFSTPIYKKPKKKTRINIFMRGKINILGAFYANVTRQICEYLHWIFINYYDTLVVLEGSAKTTPTGPTWIENIEQCTDDELFQIIGEFINWIHPLPSITNEEYYEIVKFIDDTYKKAIDDANNYIRDKFAGTEIGRIIDDLLIN